MDQQLAHSKILRFRPRHYLSLPVLVALAFVVVGAAAAAATASTTTSTTTVRREWNDDVVADATGAILDAGEHRIHCPPLLGNRRVFDAAAAAAAATGPSAHRTRRGRRLKEKREGMGGVGSVVHGRMGEAPLCLERIDPSLEEEEEVSTWDSSISSSSARSERAEDSNLFAVVRGGGEGGGGEVSELVRRLKIGAYFGLWYALNIIYNIINKKLLNVLPAPLTVGSIQFGIGAVYAAVLWALGIRKAPKLTSKGRDVVWRVGLYHCAGQLLSMISLGAGPVSFTHIVKALEPFFSALVSALVFGKWMKPPVYATLIPVVGGVSYACMKERSFSWLAFWTAMSSNVAFALRAVVSKSAMDGRIGENIDSVNLFGLVTWAAFFLSIPTFVLGEGLSLLSIWSKAVGAGDGSDGGGEGGSAIAETTTASQLVRAIVLSGMFHYLNNEVMYLALSNVHPVTLAVGNTMKRVFIMVASVIVFRNPVSMQAAVGSAIGIGGVLVYSLTKQYYEKLEAAEAAAKAT